MRCTLEPLHNCAPAAAIHSQGKLHCDIFAPLSQMKVKEYKNGLQVYSLNVAEVLKLFESKRSPRYYIEDLECVVENEDGAREVHIEVPKKPPIDVISVLGNVNPIFESGYISKFYKIECMCFVSFFLCTLPFLEELPLKTSVLAFLVLFIFPYYRVIDTFLGVIISV